MKKLLLLVAIPGCFLAAGEEKKPNGPNTLPPGAVKVEEGLYKYTDAQGKKWIYRNTPFALMKLEDKSGDSDQKKADPSKPQVHETPFGKVTVPPEATPKTPSQADETFIRITKVREEGNMLHFERPSPFGVRRWARNKSELTEEEKIVWERSKNSSSTQKVRE